MSTNWQKFPSFVDYLAKGGVNLSTDQIYCMLTNTAPPLTATKYADIAGNELANGNGYATGGMQVPNTAYANNAGVATLTAGTTVFTSAVANMGPLRYAVFYDFTAANKPLLGFFDYGSSASLNGAAGENFTVSTGGTLLTVQ